jgi:membrane dipeptidase
MLFVFLFLLFHKYQVGATLKEVADHIDHIRAVCGGSCDHIGIGADYDGIVDVSRGLGNVSKVRFS